MLSLPGAAAGDAMRLSAISALPGSPRWQTWPVARIPFKAVLGLLPSAPETN